MIYYKKDSEVKVMDGNQACFFPDGTALAMDMANKGTLYPDEDFLNMFRNDIGDSLKDKCLIDVGANYGSYTIALQDLFAHVYAFELNKSVYNILCANAALCGFSDKSTLYCCGLSDKEEVLTYAYLDTTGSVNCFRRDDENDLSNRLYHKNDWYESDWRHDGKLRVFTLDSFNITNVGVIKIDVEGFELDVLKGAEQTILKSNYPILIVESWNVEENDLEDVKKAKTELREKLFDHIQKHLGYTMWQCGYDNFICKKV